MLIGGDSSAAAALRPGIIIGRNSPEVSPAAARLLPHSQKAIYVPRPTLGLPVSKRRRPLPVTVCKTMVCIPRPTLELSRSKRTWSLPPIREEVLLPASPVECREGRDRCWLPLYKKAIYVPRPTLDCPDPREGGGSRRKKRSFFPRPTLAAVVAEERVPCPERFSREALTRKQSCRVEIDVDALSGGKGSRREKGMEVVGGAERRTIPSRRYALWNQVDVFFEGETFTLLPP